MITLILCIVLTSALFVCFKWFDTRGVELLPAIIGNYIACIITGLLMQDGSTDISDTNIELVYYCFGLGILFFAIFYCMGYVSAKIGVGISSASSKLSLVIPVLFGAVFLKEDFDIFKGFALILAIPAVLLMSWNSDEKWKPGQFSIPLIIFAGSGLIDTSMNLIKRHYGSLSNANSITLIFLSALVCSSVFLVIRRKHYSKPVKDILFGMILGVPNYFSLHFMMETLGSGKFTSGQFYLINNTGVMILSFILGRILFSEKLNKYRVTGLILSILAIYLVLFA